MDVMSKEFPVKFQQGGSIEKEWQSKSTEKMREIKKKRIQPKDSKQGGRVSLDVHCVASQQKNLEGSHNDGKLKSSSS